MGNDGVVTGAITIVVLIVLVLPPLFLITGGILSAIVGWASKRNADAQHAGSDLAALEG